MAISQKTYRYTAPLSGRTFAVEQRTSSQWEAWYDDDHSMTYVARTMKEVIGDVLSDDVAPEIKK